MLGRAGGEAGDDEADVEAERGRLDAGTGTGDRVFQDLRPGSGSRHSRAAPASRAARTAGADIVGGVIDERSSTALPGRPKM